LALKVDRIRKGEKRKAIQTAEVTMQIGRDLAASPHVIRVYDAGTLKGKKYTYHVLQLVDGDTLDNLVGITGTEHSSVHRPEKSWESADEIETEYLQAMRRSPGEAWRRRQLALPFTDAVSLSQLLDLLTSILLWVEETHGVGYAINDLKNGNLMVSRRGQLKGIDMDSYGPLSSSRGWMPDFFFLAPSLLLLLMNAPHANEMRHIDAEAFLASPRVLRDALTDAWPFGDVAEISRGRIATDEVVEMIVRLIHCSRDRTYVRETDRFSTDIDRLIHLKRSIFIEEIVLD
jgi:serine/threonine protein kinase